MAEEDRKAIACNYVEAISSVSVGALAYLQWPNWGWDNDRVPLLVRSRGGRWIRKWEAMRRLGNFRIKTIPPAHRLYSEFIYRPSEADLQRIREACERESRRTE